MTHEQKARLIIEKRELNERAARLNDFLEGAEYEALPAEHRYLLATQYNAMLIYERALLRRMELLGMLDGEWDDF